VDVGVSAILLGLSHEALKLTAAYVTERHQFGIPIGSFQAVQQRAADAWIQTQVMEASLWQAAWRVESGLASSRECAIARYHASEGSHFVCAAAQHLHGGFGFDRDYPLHRYFLAARQHEFILGGANAQLEKLGDLLAESPARF
jgi:alkylation response protein AidB-like acyl-CoA dehydrogenase